MPVQVSTNRQFCAPSAANGVVRATAGAAWSNSGYTEIVPNTGGEVWVLTGIIVWSTDDNATADDMEFDIATGVAASEVVKATVRRRQQNQATVLMPQQFRFMIPIDGISGRIAVRIRTSHTRTVNWNVSLTYIKNPIDGVILVTKSALIVFPSAANSISFTTAGTAWLDTGSFTTIVASLISDFVLTHCVSHLSQSGAEGEIDIAIGGAGSEIVVTTYPISAKSAGNVSGSYYEFPNPLDVFPTGTRISYRARCDQASKAITMALMGNYKPL